MPTLIERARQVIAAEDDDFFQAETIQYYLNRGQRKVISFMINKERELGKSLRALDNLKSVDNTILDAGTAKDTYFQVDLDFPADLNQFENLVYNQQTILKEISVNKLYMLEWGNLLPTQYEGYYYVTNDGTNRVFRLYIHEDPDTTTDAVDLFYVKEPTDIGLTDETFAELPDQLINAVIYAAATMMASQEMSEGTQGYQSLYEQELISNVY